MAWLQQGRKSLKLFRQAAQAANAIHDEVMRGIERNGQLYCLLVSKNREFPRKRIACNGQVHAPSLHATSLHAASLHAPSLHATAAGNEWRASLAP